MANAKGGKTFVLAVHQPSILDVCRIHPPQRALPALIARRLLYLALSQTRTLYGPCVLFHAQPGWYKRPYPANKLEDKTRIKLLCVYVLFCFTGGFCVDNVAHTKKNYDVGCIILFSSETC